MPGQQSPPARPRLVVLDMAGTTVEDDGQVPAAFAAALAHHGIAVSEAQISEVRGASKREAIARWLPEGPERGPRAAEVFETFRERLAERYRRGVRAVAGARTCIDTLRSRGMRVVLNTGFDRDTTALLADALGWTDGVVDAIVCGDDVLHGRPAPDLIFAAMARAGVDDVGHVASVGDTALDLRAAHHAGVRWNVGVLTGAHDLVRLRSEPHTVLLASLADLAPLWPDV